MLFLRKCGSESFIHAYTSPGWTVHTCIIYFDNGTVCFSVPTLSRSTQHICDMMSTRTMGWLPTCYFLSQKEYSLLHLSPRLLYAIFITFITYLCQHNYYHRSQRRRRRRRKRIGKASSPRCRCHCH